MLTPRTRTVLRLMLFTVFRRIGSMVKTLIWLVALLTYVLGSFSVNLLTKFVVETAWSLRTIPRQAWPAGLWFETIVLVGMSVLALLVFWSFVVRNRHYPLAKGPDRDRWILGLPYPGFSRTSGRWELLVTGVMCAFYLANAFVIFFSFIVGQIAWFLLINGWILLGHVRDALRRLGAPMPNEATTSTWQRMKIQLTRAWDAQSQRMLEAHPQARVSLEQHALRGAAPDVPASDTPRARPRL